MVQGAAEDWDVHVGLSLPSRPHQRNNLLGCVAFSASKLEGLPSAPWAPSMQDSPTWRLEGTLRSRGRCGNGLEGSTTIVTCLQETTTCGCKKQVPRNQGCTSAPQGIPNHVHLARQLAGVAPSKNQAFHGKRFVPLVRSHHADHPRVGLACCSQGCSQSLGDIGSMPLVGIDGALAYLRVVLAPQRPAGQRRLGAPVGTRDERLPRLVLGRGQISDSTPWK